MLRFTDGVNTLQGITVVLGSTLTLSESTSGQPQIDVTPAAPGSGFFSALRILANTVGGHRQLWLVDHATETKYNWMFGTQPGSDDVQLVPSTVIGGTTFSTALITFQRASGNVGIGTDSPLARLDAVTQATGSHNLQASAYIGTTGGTDFPDNGRASLRLIRGRNTLASPQALSTGDTVGKIIFGGYNTTPALTNAAVILVVLDAAVGAGVLPGAIAFQTGALTERMRITSTGLVGIGTNAPTELLSLERDQNATTRIVVTNTDTTNSSSRAGVRVVAGTITGEILAIIGNGVVMGSVSSDTLALMTNSIQRVTIDTSGNTTVLGSGSSAGKLKANRFILPAGVDLWAT